MSNEMSDDDDLTPEEEASFDKSFAEAKGLLFLLKKRDFLPGEVINTACYMIALAFSASEALAASNEFERGAMVDDLLLTTSGLIAAQILEFREQGLL